MGLEIPKSANSNQPSQRPLPDVDPQWLLMAAAHMQSIGKFDPFTGSAYEAESKFSDAEMSKNLEDRRSFGDMENLATTMGMREDLLKRQGKTDPDIPYDTTTPDRNRMRPITRDTTGHGSTPR